MTIQVTKVWWDGEKLMAEPIDPFSIYKEPEQPAQPQQEPVAWRAWFDADNSAKWVFTLWPEEEHSSFDWQPLYTIPPQRKPLTEFERMKIIGQEFPLPLVQSIVIQKIDLVCKAIEAAHGIKENT